MDVSFNFNKDTYFTEFQILMTVHSVHLERINILCNGALITDHHVMIENKNKTVEINIFQSQQQQQQQQQLV